MSMRTITIITILCSLLLLTKSYAAEVDAIKARLKPIGEVTVADTNKTTPDSNAKPADANADKGKQIYNSKCSVCHEAGVAGAPKKGDKAVWDKRLADVKGVDNLVKSAVAGKNGVMPPKGTCNECSDADLKAAIEYMIGTAK